MIAKDWLDPAWLLWLIERGDQETIHTQYTALFTSRREVGLVEHFVALLDPRLLEVHDTVRHHKLAKDLFQKLAIHLWHCLMHLTLKVMSILIYAL